MPTAVSIAQKAGLAAHLAVGGEILVIRNKEIRCLLNRAVADEDHQGRPNFATRSGADILIPSSTMTSAPRVGEVIKTPCGEEFRIRQVQFTGISYSCRCDVK